jgi:hypothetical protein
MIFCPSKEIHDRFRAELAGVFIDRSVNAPYIWLVAKLPMNLIREIRAGAGLSLLVWTLKIDADIIYAFGLRVHDDPSAPRTFFGCCRSDDETWDLRALLDAGSFPLQVHNENFLPLLSVQCRFDPDEAKDVINVIPSPVTQGEEGFRVRERANDAIEELLAGHDTNRIAGSCAVPLCFENTEILKVHVIGSGDISLDDPDEGRELERLTFQAFDSLFPFGTFHGPLVGTVKKRRELCDVLAVSRVRELENEGVFVIQNKVASASSKGLKRKTARRAKSIQNNILAGIRQLEGAIKMVRAGEHIYRADGSSIEIDPAQIIGPVEPLSLRQRAAEIGQGIVLISDMHEEVDWQAVFLALGKVFLSTKYYCHVLDLQELGRLITHSRGRPAIFEGLLLRRGAEMLKNRHALVRFHFVGGKH